VQALREHHRNDTLGCSLPTSLEMGCWPRRSTTRDKSRLGVALLLQEVTFGGGAVLVEAEVVAHHLECLRLLLEHETEGPF
jgi:hypothetical protein